MLAVGLVNEVIRGSPFPLRNGTTRRDELQDCEKAGTALLFALPQELYNLLLDGLGLLRCTIAPHGLSFSLGDGSSHSFHLIYYNFSIQLKT